ncbi:MAG: glycosyltransferase family 39 protein [Crocinitomicaceae bacterium]|nr:glycosyltransferase family 39 protein [Crocinitomicaceae bacterium]
MIFSKSHKKPWYIWASAILILIDLFCFNHLLELRNEEPRRAIVAIEMMESADYLIPNIFGEPYYNKPPLYNWILAGSFSIFGNGELAVRLPGIVSLILTAFFLWKISANYLASEFRLLLPFIYLTTSDLLYFGSVNAGEIDLFYSLIVCLQVYSIFYFKQRNSFFTLFIVSYLLCAIGVLTKGMPSLAFQALTLLFYFIANKEFKKLFSIQHLTGIIILSIIVGGYLYVYSLQADLPAFLSQQFKEASQRTGNESTFLKLILQVFIFPLTVIEKLFPWSLLALPLIIKNVRQQIWQNKLIQFSIIFILANIIIYWTAPDLRIRYIYMFFPFMILITVAGYSLVDTEKIKWLNIPKYIFSFGIFTSGTGSMALTFILGIKDPLSITFSFILGLLLLLLGYKAIKSFYQSSFFWILVLAMSIGRLGYNIIVIPHMSDLNKDLNYRSIVNQMIIASDEQPIYYTGDKQKIEPNITLAGKEIYKDVFYTPIDIPFQIPYYYAHLTGKVMKYLDTPNSEATYLMYKRDLWMYEGQKEELYEFQANTNSETLVLFKMVN